MEELIAKRYVKALLSDTDAAFLKNVTTLFEEVAASFKNEKFLNIVANTEVSNADKTALLLEVVKPAKSERINNFVKLLVENKRVDVIPAVSEELRKTLARTTKTYAGTVFSNANIKAKVLTDLSKGLSKKYDSKVVLAFKKSDFNGIKVEVDDLGIEIDFSKERINSQLIEHIIKAI